MMASLSFCTISPCIAETVKFAVRIFSVNQSTYTKARVSNSVSRICSSKETRDFGSEHDVQSRQIQWWHSAHGHKYKQETRRVEQDSGGRRGCANCELVKNASD